MRAAKPVRGYWRSLRNATNTVLVLILFSVPWVRIGSEPLVLLDIPKRQFHTFGLIIFPQELYFLWLLIAVLVLSLFFFTAIGGRLWCGYACPQTVFTDLFAGIGRALATTRLSPHRKQVPLSRRLVVHGVWLSISFLVAFHLVGYFVSPYSWKESLARGELPRIASSFVLVLGVIAYLDFAFLRQRFCKFLCPYARLQSVLFDRDTLVIAYDRNRGEPRGKRGRVEGDCVNCGLCVAVCPSEIDIRDGLQLECIACTQCIDACNQVMRQIGRQENLIGYRSLSQSDGNQGQSDGDHSSKTRLPSEMSRASEKRGESRGFRPRVVAYGGLLLVAASSFAIALARREPLELSVRRNRSALYSQTASGEIGNAYTLEIENRSRRARRFQLALEESRYRLVAGLNPIQVPATAHIETKVFVLDTRTAGHSQTPSASAASSNENREIHFVLQALDAPSERVTRRARFIAPSTRREP